MVTNLAVWGDPISHSRSPQLHAAAYDVLGLDWVYGRQQVGETGFSAALDALDGTWLGLSLTMPLKRLAFAVSDSLDDHARLTGAVNTLTFGQERSGFNTDAGGIIDALAEAGIPRVSQVRILGAGATAASALVAVAAIGAAHVEVRARRAASAHNLRELGTSLGVKVTIAAFDDATAPVDLTVATLPSGTVLDTTITRALARDGGVLFEAAYAPWPSALVATWDARVVSGFGMLVYQAVRQVRIWVNGDQDTPLQSESDVVAAMRVAVGD